MFMQLLNNLDIQILNFTKHDVLGPYINDFKMITNRACECVTGHSNDWYLRKLKLMFNDFCLCQNHPNFR